MAFLDSTAEQTLFKGDAVIVGDYGQYRLGKIARCFMAEVKPGHYEPFCAVKFFMEEIPVIYSCSAVTKLTTVGSDQWVRMDCVPTDALPKPGDDIMVLSQRREYRVVKFIEVDGHKVRFFVDGQRYVSTQSNSYIRFIVGEPA